MKDGFFINLLSIKTCSKNHRITGQNKAPRSYRPNHGGELSRRWHVFWGFGDNTPSLQSEVPKSMKNFERKYQKMTAKPTENSPVYFENADANEDLKFFKKIKEILVR